MEEKRGEGERERGRDPVPIIATAIRYCIIDTTHLAGGKRRTGFPPSSRTRPAPRRKRAVASSAEEEDGGRR
jgi:hypothetical protein